MSHSLDGSSATARTAPARIIGRKPKGNADGTERWASVREDDGQTTITIYRGWLITDEIKISGSHASPIVGFTIDSIMLAGLA